MRSSAIIVEPDIMRSCTMPGSCHRAARLLWFVFCGPLKVYGYWPVLLKRATHAFRSPPDGVRWVIPHHIMVADTSCWWCPAVDIRTTIGRVQLIPRGGTRTRAVLRPWGRPQLGTVWSSPLVSIWSRLSYVSSVPFGFSDKYLGHNTVHHIGLSSRL